MNSMMGNTRSYHGTVPAVAGGAVSLESPFPTRLPQAGGVTAGSPIGNDEFPDREQSYPDHTPSGTGSGVS